MIWQILARQVRLGRADCVEVLAELCGGVSVPDGFNLTPLQYGLLLLYKDRHNKTVQVCSVVQCRCCSTAAMQVLLYDCNADVAV